MNLQTLEVNGTGLTYIEAGQGSPLIFVHGSLDDYRSWRLQCEPFARHFHIFALSRRYHYPNQWRGHGMDYSAQLHADDLAAFIERLELGPVHLVTSSYGGIVGLWVTHQRPALVRSLVVGEPPLLPWLEQVPGGAALQHAFTTRVWLPSRAAFEEGRSEDGVRLFLDGVMGRPTLQHLGRRAYQMMMDNAPEMEAETLATEYFPPFTCVDAGRLRQPVLLCKGELSPNLFHLITERLAECLSDARMVVVPGASHAMHVGNTTFYNEIVLAFLAGLAS